MKNQIVFWSWNEKLDKSELLAQIEKMHAAHLEGFIMHARSGLISEYLGKEWMDCVKFCIEEAEKRGMKVWIYDENGWPSGFVGGKLLSDEKNRENYLTVSFGEYDEKSFISYDISGEDLKPAKSGENCLNVFLNLSVSTVDVLDGEVVEKFIFETHERYKSEFGGKFLETVEGFFTDEPQYYRNATAYPHKIAEYFSREYGENVLDRLGLLFVEKNGYRDFRYKYYKALQSLFLKNFAEKVYSWCDNNGVKLTGHYVEERDLFSQIMYNAGIMPFYEYLHVPGIDWLTKRFMSVVPMRQVGSVAAQLGKTDVLTESFAMTGWTTTPAEFKAMAEYQFMYGVNKLCYHLYPYSEKGDRKHDHPAHFSEINPWAKRGLSILNGYLDFLSEFFKTHVEKVKVAVLHPVRSAYFYYKEGDLDSTAFLDKGFLSYCNDLSRRGISFHLIDETLLNKYGAVKGKTLTLGKCGYDCVIIPPQVKTMDKPTELLIRAYVNNGGKVIVAGERPEYLEGKPFDYDYLESNYSVSLLEENGDMAVKSSGGDARAVYLFGDDGERVFVLNADFNDGATVKIKTKKDGIERELYLQPCQSEIIKVGEKKERKATDEREFSLRGAKIISASDNFLPLDKACYSTDGENFSEETPIAGIFKLLLEKRYDGDVYLKTSFYTDYIPEKISLTREKGQYNIATVNGKEISVSDFSADGYDYETADISRFIIAGENQVIMKTRFYQSERVYGVLFGKGVTEGLKNCLTFDTYFDTFRLKGNFGVYGKTLKSAADGVFVLGKPYISRPKTVADGLINSGYPFLSGEIELSKTVNLNGGETTLKFADKIHYARICVNGEYVGEICLGNRLDVTGYVRKGENTVKVSLFTSARNIFGPHHNKNCLESGFVYPNTYTLFDCFINGKSDEYFSDYSLVEIIK